MVFMSIILYCSLLLLITLPKMNICAEIRDIWCKILSGIFLLWTEKHFWEPVLFLKRPVVNCKYFRLNFKFCAFFLVIEIVELADMVVVTVYDIDKSSAAADMPPEHLYERIRQRPPRNCKNNVSPTFDALNEGHLLELSGSYLVWETRMAGLQSGEGRMMIDSVVWTQHINMTDTQRATHPRRDSNSRPDVLRFGGKKWSSAYSGATALNCCDLWEVARLYTVKPQCQWMM